MSQSDDPKYHDAPHTLDPNREIPEDAPPSAGHDEEMAEKVKAADDTFTEEVEAEEQERERRDAERAEQGLPTPSEKLAEDSGVQPQQANEDDADDGDSEDVPDGTVQEVLDWVGDDHERAQRALKVERDGQNRSTLVSELESR